MPGPQHPCSRRALPRIILQCLAPWRCSARRGPSNLAFFAAFFFFSPLPNEIKTPLTSLLQLQLDLSTLSQDYRTGQGRQVENNPAVPISSAKISAISRPFMPVGSSLHPPRCRYCRRSLFSWKFPFSVQPSSPFSLCTRKNSTTLTRLAAFNRFS